VRVRSLAVLAALVHAPADVPAQNPTLDSYRRAREVVEASIQALGGRAAFTQLDTLRVTWTGDLVNRHQSRRVPPPYDRTPHHGELVMAGARLRFDNAFSYPGGFDGLNGARFDGATGCNVDLLRRTSGPAPAAALGNLRGALLDRFPFRHLETALAQARGLRYAGQFEFEGRPHDVVTYAAVPRLMTLWIDAATHLPSKVDMLISDPVTGDAVQETIWPGYVEMRGLRVPTGRITRVAGEVTVDTRLDWTLGGAPADTAFACPAGYDSAVGGPPRLAVRPLAEGLHLAEGVAGNSVLVAEFADHLLVVEPPGGDDASRELIGELARRFAGKPVRWVVATHHHDDHTGGLRAYMEEGATVVTTAGNVAHFRRVAARRGTLDGVDRPVEPRFEVVNGRRTFGSGPAAIEVLDIGPNPHTEEMLVAYAPAARLLFQGDMLNAQWSGKAYPANATTVAFAAWLARSGLAVDRVAGVHGPVQDRSRLDEMVALAGGR
jgi:glyoxylase-like metal-dependent hydrolase (beta-lactamase superfamily II)